MDLEIFWFHIKKLQEPLFCEIITRKNQYDKNIDNKITQWAKESFRIGYFIYKVDQAISSLPSRFHMHLGFLFNFNKFSLNDNSLKKYCLNL